METINQKIGEFKKHGILYLESLKETELNSMLELCSEYYYNSQQKTILTDSEFDILKEYIQRKYPKNTVITKIGAPVGKNKALLPYEMPSMDKIKPDSNALKNWMKKYTAPYVISCKLDGVSGMYSTERGIHKLYTRGDGKIGQDITHILELLNLPQIPNLVVRGEFIISKKVFEEKYKTSFANPRNLVSGIINSKTIDEEKIKDIHFVVYEIIQPPMKPSDQMKKLAEYGFEVVLNQTVVGMNNNGLSEVLVDWRNNHIYEIDGVIVNNDKIYARQSGNPEHAFAFKMVLGDQQAEAKVVDVIWTASKMGYLKPRVRIEPVVLSGVTIEYATGFNAKFIEENRIGVGAIIQIIRSGDVIPFIKSVSVPAEITKMPTDIAYTWNDTRVDIIVDNLLENETVREKNITAFFVYLEVDGLSSGNTKRIMKAGFDSISKILKMKVEDFEKVEGFKKKMAEKIHGSIQEKIENATLFDIMVASNKLGKGMGTRKIKLIMDQFSQILDTTESDEEKNKMLMTIKGIGYENAHEFISNISNFNEFLVECELEYKKRISTTPTNTNATSIPSTTQTEDLSKHPLYGKSIVMTKVRDREIIELLPKYNATLSDNMKKDTFVLIVKSKEDESKKTEFAKKNGIPIMTVEEFLGNL
jgi:DNA ligase (NAD+)